MPEDEPTLREIADYLRQIESANYSAALARAEREIANEMMLLEMAAQCTPLSEWPVVEEWRMRID